MIDKICAWAFVTALWVFLNWIIGPVTYGDYTLVVGLSSGLFVGLVCAQPRMDLTPEPKANTGGHGHMTPEQMRQSLEDMREDVARYGARLGVVEPCFHRVMQALTIIEAVQAELRAAKMYEQSDKLRAATKIMRDGAGYAFSNRYKGK